MGTGQRLVSEHGWLSLTRGGICCLGREGLFTMAMLGLCPVLQTSLMEKYKLGKNTGRFECQSKCQGFEWRRCHKPPELKSLNTPTENLVFIPFTGQFICCPSSCPFIASNWSRSFFLLHTCFMLVIALASGSLMAALFSASLTHPMDTIKTCMQGDVEQKKYTNIRHTASLLAKEHGIAKGLFKGFTWRASLITTSFFLINSFKGVLAPVMFPESGEKN